MLTPSLVFAQSIGIGASPMKVEVGLGNETNISNDIDFEFNIYNTGDIRIRVIPVYIDEQLKNFSRPLIDELIIQPQEMEKFPILFFRNGTEEKLIEANLRFVAEPNETTVSGMIAVRPATDIKINLIQKPMIFGEEEKKTPYIVYWLFVVCVVCLVIIGYIWYKIRK